MVSQAVAVCRNECGLFDQWATGTRPAQSRGIAQKAGVCVALAAFSPAGAAVVGGVDAANLAALRGPTAQGYASVGSVSARGGVGALLGTFSKYAERNLSGIEEL